MARSEVLAEVAAHVLAVRRPHPVRVAVDGCSAAGKTTFADELASLLPPRPVLRVELDRFARPVPLRTAYPVDSPDSYYRDTWDRAAIRDAVLIPLGPGGSRRYRLAAPADAEVRTAPPDAVLLADGVFLQVPELDPYWDLRIFLDVGFDVVLRRGVERDRARMPAAAERYRTKYVPGERSYLAEVRPRDRAQLVLDNTDPADPRLTAVRPG